MIFVFQTSGTISERLGIPHAVFKVQPHMFHMLFIPVLEPYFNESLPFVFVWSQRIHIRAKVPPAFSSNMVGVSNSTTSPNDKTKILRMTMPVEPRFIQKTPGVSLVVLSMK